MSNHWEKEQHTPVWVANQLIHGFAKKDHSPEMNDPDFRVEVDRRLQEVGYKLITYNDSEWWGALNTEDSMLKLMTRKGADLNTRAFIAVLWRELVWPCVQQNSKNKQTPCITEKAFGDKYRPLIDYVCQNKANYTKAMNFLRQNKFMQTVSKKRLGLKRQSVWEAGPALELWIDRDVMQTAMDQTYLFHSEGRQENA